MPKATYTVSSTSVISPVKNHEVSLFTAAINSPVTQAALKKLGVSVPDSVPVVHNTGVDDPPDIEALGWGWECTEFPPNQSAIEAVHEKQGAMVVPGFSQTGADVREIRKRANPYTAMPETINSKAEIEALEKVFVEKVIGGAKSKDISCNQVLLLDQRDDGWPEFAEIALRQGLAKKRPVHIRLVLLVRWERTKVNYSNPPVPVVVAMITPPKAPADAAGG